MPYTRRTATLVGMWRRWLAVGALLAVGGVACTGDDGGSTSPTAPLEPTTQSTADAPPVSAPSVTTLAPGDETGSSSAAVNSVPPTAAPPATLESRSGQSSTSTCDDVPVGVTERLVSAGGADHPVRIYVPSMFAGQALPVVLNWHGLGSTGADQAAYTGYEALAESAGFIVVHPTGVPAPGSNLNSWELADGQDLNRDDVAFANALIDVLIDDWCADATRVTRRACPTAASSPPDCSARPPSGSRQPPRSPAPITPTAALRHGPCPIWRSTAPLTSSFPSLEAASRSCSPMTIRSNERSSSK